MGVDSRLYIPPTVPLRVFVDAISTLVGDKPMARRSLGGDMWCADPTVPVAAIATHNTVPEMLSLEGCVGGYWHWESSEKRMPGARLFTCRAYAHRIPVLVALCDLFGGVLDYNDCDDVDVDYVGFGTAGVEWNAESGDSWCVTQDALLGIRPLGIEWFQNSEYGGTFRLPSQASRRGALDCSVKEA